MLYILPSVYAHEKKEYNLPSIQFLRTLKDAGLDTVRTLTLLKKNGSISEDVILMFDEMYLQQCEEYSAGRVEGTNEDGEMYTGVMAFMIVGLKSSVPFVVRAVPKTKLDGDWIKDELDKTLMVLIQAGFKVSNALLKYRYSIHSVLSVIYFVIRP